MEKSEGDISPCPYCGGREIDTSCMDMGGALRCLRTRHAKKVGCGKIFYSMPIHPARLKSEGLIKLKEIPHYGCNYLGIDGEVCTKCGELVKASRDIPLAFANLTMQLQGYKAEVHKIFKTLGGIEFNCNCSMESRREGHDGDCPQAVLNTALADARKFLENR